MKKITIIFIGLFLIILAFTFINKDTGNSNNVPSPTQDSNNSLESRENNEGPVAIVVTPLNLKDSVSTWNFEITLDTHSGILDTDLVAVSELLDDQGKSYKPISWEGDSLGGHHRKGILKFKPVLPKPKPIELRIKNVGGIPERSFKWTF